MLTGPDFLLVALLLGALVWMGARCGQGQTDTRDFFLARRSIPGWAAALSFVATEVSALTIVSVPATAYRENWQYAQFFIGSALARLVVASIFIPAFYAHDCATIYEYLLRRFGPSTQRAAVGLFFVTRLLGSGVRLMVASLGVSILLGWNIGATILIFTVVGILYLGAGGIKAAIWGSVLQAVCFIGAGVASLFYIALQVEGGFGGIIAIASAAGRTHLINWGPALSDPGFVAKTLTDPNIIWLAALNGFMTSLAAFGTDQDQMQRMLSVSTREASARSTRSTIFWSGFVVSLFLLLGSALFAYYATHPDAPLPSTPDKVFPHFAATIMPPLLRGLVLAAIIMASIDSPLGGLSAAFVTDVYRPLRGGRSESHYLAVARGAIVGFGIILAGIAYGFHFMDRHLWLAFKIGGVTFGSLLGVFLLGLLTRRGRDDSNIVAMHLAVGINLMLLILSEASVISLAWSWLVILGTGITMTMGAVEFKLRATAGR